MWWSWILTAVGVTGLYFAGKNNKLGWAIGIFAQTLWTAYALATEQYGFLVSAGAYGWIYVKNYMKWRNDERSSRNQEGRSDASQEFGSVQGS